MTWIFEPNFENQKRYVLYGKDFRISYVEVTLFSIDGCTETALIKDGMYYFLDGDFRHEYSQLAEKGFDACLKFYEENEDFHSMWSNPV